MILVCEVERGGEPERVEITTDLDDERDTMRVVALCGVPALQRMASGEWDNTAAQAILYVNLLRALAAPDEPDWTNPPFKFSEMALNWGELTEFMVEPDKDFEAEIPMEAF